MCEAQGLGGARAVDLGVISTWVVVSTAGEHEVTRMSVDGEEQRAKEGTLRNTDIQGQVEEVSPPDKGGRKKQENQKARGGEDKPRAWDSAWC